VKQKTKARQLLQIAYATYQRDEHDIAKDIFILAMEDATAAVEFGGATKQQLQVQLNEAVAAGEYDQAAECLEAMEEAPDDEPLPQMDEDVDDDIEEEEAAVSPGDFVETELPTPELAPAQVASLVTLARKIKADGHPDLAKRITRALGL
jgi:hypothetical protein